MKSEYGKESGEARRNGSNDLKYQYSMPVHDESESFVSSRSAMKMAVNENKM